MSEQVIKVHDKFFVPYLSPQEVEERIVAIASQINQDYAGKQPIFIAILNGSFQFAAVLFKNIELPAEITFIKLASYKGTTSSGNVITAIGLEESLTGKDIIVLEDIIDTGKTLHTFLPQLQLHQPNSIKIASLLVKPETIQYPLDIHYQGFAIPDKFVLGFGLDYDGLGRNLTGVWQLKD